MVARMNAYQIFAGNYNYDGDLGPNLHEDFKNEFYIQWKDVESFGQSNTMKVKNKLTSMSCKLNIIKSSYDICRNGAGSWLLRQSNEITDPCDMPDLGAADNHMNFLSGER